MEWDGALVVPEQGSSVEVGYDLSFPPCTLRGAESLRWHSILSSLCLWTIHLTGYFYFINVGCHSKV